MAFEMKVKGTDLAAELGTARSIIDRKKTIAVLAHVLLEVEGGALRLSATDLDVTLRTQVDAVGAGSGVITADVEALHGIARSIGADTMTLAQKGDDARLHVQAEGFKAALPALNPADYPRWPVVPKDGQTCMLPRAELRYALSSTKYAMAQNDQRFFMNGILLDVAVTKGESFTCGTDGHRVVVKGLPTVTATEAFSVTVPAKAVGALLSMLDGDGPDVTLTTGGAHLFFAFGEQVVVTRVVDGTFPPVRNIVGKVKGGGPKSVLDRVALLTAVRRTMLLSDSHTRSLSLTFEDGRVRVAAKSQDVGEGEQSVGATYEGESRIVYMGATYLADFLEASSDDRITIKLGKTERDPLLLVGGETYRCVLAPRVL